PGRAYVYFIYGNHYCFNVVTGNEGEGEAVLVRALEPVSGIELMQKRRGNKTINNLTNGPGKLCQSLKIDLSLNGISLQKPPLFIANGNFLSGEKIAVSSRIGISKGQDKQLRFYIQYNPYVSGTRS
ncbi:MAG: DNA-3-methyladenine glycosylase, partial [Firmicutes bacterium]|nr:DNA-3-methyladenine glycosylase [Bacillota bacterium]